MAIAIIDLRTFIVINNTYGFIPLSMLPCGGLWEAGVQSAKGHLCKLNKDTKLTYEEISKLSTLLAQIEACLNSQPLNQIDNTMMPNFRDF